MDLPDIRRRFPIGAELLPGGGAHFRVWAPACARVEVVWERGSPDSGDPGSLHPDPGDPGDPAGPNQGPGPPAAPEPPADFALDPEPGGYHSGFAPEARAGMRYRFRLDDQGPFPDPASRFQPEGPHGPSELVDPAAYHWNDHDWAGPELATAIVYEMHVGTFTSEGTWEAAARHLPRLAELGITVVELMPIAEFPGRFGWGYDGVGLFAPTRNYGRPDDLRRFVDAAHGLGIAVILDVVYNHLGPEGNYLARFSPSYFTDRYPNEWGEAIDFDGEGAGPVREFFLANAAYWVTEYHLDGYRLDATQQIYDASPDPIVAAIAREARRAALPRRVLVFAENEPQDARLVRSPEHGGFGLDALWNDDFHHAARVALTGRTEAYFSDYRGTAQELVSAAERGFLYQGQFFAWQGRRRGTPALDLPPAAFVHYLENHDQVANSRDGARLSRLTSPGRLRAATALLLLGPATPLLFQGQEFGASAPFVYFADLEGELGEAVRRGRFAFLSQFPSLAGPDAGRELPDPCSAATFERCRLDHGEWERNAALVALHRDLLALRRTDPVLARARATGVDGAVLGPEAFVLRYSGEDGDDRLLLVNLGRALRLSPAPEPLLAPPPARIWQPVWSSDDARYGGPGVTPIDLLTRVDVPGESATLFAAAPEGADGATGAAGGAGA